MSDSAPPPENPDSLTSALRLKSLAEEKYKSSSLTSALKYARRAHRLRPDLDGLSQLLHALKILHAPASDHYKILLLEPFSHINTIKKQYKTLALVLHPDKSGSPVPAAEEAFKRVAESFRLLSDRVRRTEFDLRLRIAIAEQKSNDKAKIETFWTACSTCRLLHEFDRRYVGHRLVCPSCRKSFLAVEVPENGADDGARVRVRADWVRAARSRSNSRPRVYTDHSAENRKRRIGVLDSLKSKKPIRRKEMTLAEMQVEAKRKAKEKKEKEKKKGNEKALVTQKGKNDDLSLMAVEDSDFYDFDKDRVEKSFMKGQVWAIYDDDDGMPRHYGLIDEVLSSNRFRVRMSWLDVQNNGDEALVLWENSGFHISCGRFKVGRKIDIDSLNFFSHLVVCERVAKEIYRIFPKKGSVWALYCEQTCGGEERNYGLAVLLTSYSETHGLSMAYLEKVDGFKTIFKRQEIGCHAVKWLEKDDFRLFSHQIPARKLSGTESPDLPGECWELDPASLPSHLLSIGWGR